MTLTLTPASVGSLSLSQQLNITSLSLTTGVAVAAHAGSYTHPIGAMGVEADSSGNVLFGENLLVTTRTGDFESNIADFMWSAKYMRLYTRNIVLREMGDPVDLRLERFGNNNTYPYGSPQGSLYGLLSGQVMGAIVFGGACTPVGGTPGTTAGATMRSWSVGIRGAATEDIKRINGTDDALGGKLEFLTTANLDDTQTVRLTIDQDGRIDMPTAGGKTTLKLSSTSADTGLTIGADVTLYRASADNLKTDDTFTALKYVASLGAADDAFVARGFDAGSRTLLAGRVSGDTADRFWIRCRGDLNWGAGSSTDIVVGRNAANELYLDTGDALWVGKATDAGGNYVQFFEQTAAPAAGAANTGRLYLEDNGSGKTRLVIKYSDGSVGIIDTQV